MLGAQGPAHYALKEIPLEGPESEEDAETQREVKLLSQIQHPNIVRYIDSFTDKAMANKDKSLYIVMELVDGSSVAELIASHTEKKQRISERVIREFFVSISHALYYIHKKKNITHRDLKPANILLGSSGNAKVADFGLSKMFEPNAR